MSTEIDLWDGVSAVPSIGHCTALSGQQLLAEICDRTSGSHSDISTAMSSAVKCSLWSDTMLQGILCLQFKYLVNPLQVVQAEDCWYQRQIPIWNICLFHPNESLSLQGWKKFSVIKLLSRGWLVVLRNGAVSGTHCSIMVISIHMAYFETIQIPQFLEQSCFCAQEQEGQGYFTSVGTLQTVFPAPLHVLQQVMPRLQKCRKQMLINNHSPFSSPASSLLSFLSKADIFLSLHFGDSQSNPINEFMSRQRSSS